MSKKRVIASNVNAKKENGKREGIEILNLSKFSKELENKGNSHIQRDRETIYIYPESIPKDRINEKEGKQFRGKMRNSIKRFANNIFYNAKTNRIEELKAEISKFDSFYKEFYRINDYSLKSLSSSNDEGKNKDIDLLLRIISEFKLSSNDIPKVKKARKEKIVNVIAEEKKAEESI